MTDKVISKKVIARVEDTDWVASKTAALEAAAGKAPAKDTSVVDKVVEDAEDPELNKKIYF